MGNEVCHHHKDPSVNIFQRIIGAGFEKHTKQIECVCRLQRFYVLEKSALCALAWLRLDVLLHIVNFSVFYGKQTAVFIPLSAELNPICYLLALITHHFLHVSRIRVKSLTLRLLKSYIYIYIYMTLVA
jgi:hypothetical protein